MSDNFEIIANNGKVYKNLRAYHIALGHAVRQALIDFAREIEEYCKERVYDFYAEYTPQDYERTYQLMNKMNIGGLIKIKIQGNFQAKYRFEYELFDFEVLDSNANLNKFGTYSNFDGVDVRDKMEGWLQNGDIIGHNSFNLYSEIDDYVDKYLDSRVQEVLNNF